MPTNIRDIDPSSVERMRTGVKGLDTILSGGLLPGRSLLLQGTPGSGRTALGLRIVAGGAAEFGEPGIILSLDPFPAQFHQEALGFGWDLHQLEASGRIRVLFAGRDDLYSSFAERESLALAKITEAAYELRARRLLIDPASEFFQLPLPPDEQRKLFADFVLKLKGLNLTAVLTTDVPADPRDPGPEESSVDAILRLDHAPAAYAGGRRQRCIEAVKARGQRVLEGRHPFRVLHGDLTVLPYAPAAESDMHVFTLDDEPPTDASEAATPEVSTGVADLDGILGGGLRRGSTTLIAGMSGTGKTELAERFITSGLGAGDRAILVTFQRNAAQVFDGLARGEAKTNGGANGRRGELTILQVEPSGVEAIEFYYRLRELAETTGATRIVVDGLRQILCGVTSLRERSRIFGLLATLFAARGITAICTYSTEEQSGLSSVAAIPETAQADAVLHLSLTEVAGRLRRVLGVLKASGAQADPSLRELVMAPDGLSLAGIPFTGGESLFESGGERPTRPGRHILTPLAHMRDFIHSARVETPEQARQVLMDLRREFDILAGQIVSRLEPPLPSPAGGAAEEGPQ